MTRGMPLRCEACEAVCAAGPVCQECGTETCNQCGWCDECAMQTGYPGTGEKIT